MPQVYWPLPPPPPPSLAQLGRGGRGGQECVSHFSKCNMGSRPYTQAEVAFANNVQVAFRVLKPPFNVLPPEVVDLIAHFYVLAQREEKRLWVTWYRRACRANRRRQRWLDVQRSITYHGLATYRDSLHPNSRKRLLLHVPIPARAPSPENTTGPDSYWEDSEDSRPASPVYSNSEED